jgi:hypothetical protein
MANYGDYSAAGDAAAWSAYGGSGSSNASGWGYASSGESSGNASWGDAGAGGTADLGTVEAQNNIAENIIDSFALVSNVGKVVKGLYDYAKSQYDPNAPVPLGKTEAQGTPTDVTGTMAGGGGTTTTTPGATTGTGSPEDELIRMQTRLIEQQVASLEKQNALIDELWPSISSYYESSLALSEAQLAATTELLPIQKEAQQASLELTKLQTESAKALLPLQQSLAEQGIELNSLQIDAIKSQTERNAALEPLLLEAMGYRKDDSGAYVPIENQPQDPILQQFEDRLNAALTGEEPISPALEKQLTEEQKLLEADLSKRLGPDWASSTPGIQAMDKFKQRADLIREEARQGAISQAGSQYLAARGLLAGEKQQKVANIAGLMGNTSSLSNVPTGVSTTNLSQLTSGGGGTADLSGLMGGGSSSVYGNIADLRNYYADQRARQDAINMGTSAGRTSALMGGLMGGAQIGAAAGGTTGALVGGGLGLLAGYLLS